MIRLLDAGGAQVLPPVGDARAAVNAWQVHVVSGADQRVKYPEWREVAASLRLVSSGGAS